MEKMTVKVMAKKKDESNAIVKDENGKAILIEKTIDIDLLDKTVLNKSNENNYPFMDKFLTKANDCIEKIVNKVKDTKTYVTDDGKPKTEDTVTQANGRYKEQYYLTITLCKLLNKSKLNDSDINTILDFVTYNDKTKTALTSEFIGKDFMYLLSRYPNIKGKQIEDFMKANNLDLVNGVFTVKA